MQKQLSRDNVCIHTLSIFFTYFRGSDPGVQADRQIGGEFF